MHKPIHVSLSILFTVVLVGCGEGVINENEDEQRAVPNPLEFIPVIPDLRWSLTSYTVDGVETVVEPAEPDPNWLSNYFLTDTLFNQDRRIAGVMDCQEYRYEFELTSPTTIQLGVSEPVSTVPDCESTVPEGLLRSILSDYTTVLVESQDDMTIDITNGNGVIASLSSVENE